MDAHNELGYTVQRLIAEDDLLELRSRINEQIRRILKNHDPEAYALLKDAADPLSIYHKLGIRPNHGSTWIKSNRLLNKEDADWFEKSKSITGLRKSLGAESISDEENLGRSNYYWRLTRPSAEDDVGPVHRDEWFWILNNDFGYNMRGFRRLKIWIAVQTEPGLNGLLVQPGSHKVCDLQWEGRTAGSIKKPMLKSELDPTSMILLSTPPGYGVIFHDRLLHGGALNQSKYCRCSIEFTFMIPKCKIFHHA